MLAMVHPLAQGRASRAFSDHLPPEPGRGDQMDGAVEVDVAEFVRADIEVDPVDAALIIEVPVRGGLDLGPGGATASATA